MFLLDSKILSLSFLQPTVHFAEEPIIRGGDEDHEEDGEDGEDGERSDEEDKRPMEKRLIRKDTPHYKKHFKITKLPKPEAVAALLQGFSPDALNSSAQAAEDEEDEEEEQSDGTPQHRHRVEEAEDSRHQVNSSQVKVKERSKHWQGAVQECRKCYISSQQDMQYTPSQHILGFKTLHIYFSLFVASLQTFDIVCMESLCHLASCIHLRWMWRCMQGHS